MRSPPRPKNNTRRAKRRQQSGNRRSVNPGLGLVSRALEKLRPFHSKGLDPSPGDGEPADGSTARRSNGCANLPALRLHLFDRDVLRDSIRQERGSDCPDPGRLPPRGVSEPRIRREQIEGVDQSTSCQEIVEPSYHFFRAERRGPP